MKEATKDKVIFLLIGFIVGVLFTVVGGLKVYKVLRTEHGGSFTMAQPKSSTSAPVKSKSSKPVPIPKRKDFKLSFEQADDAKVLQPAAHSSTEIVNEHATDGKKALKLTMLAGAAYPGLAWEVYGRDVQNWKGAKNFHLDIYNPNESPVEVEIKFKSGAKYPKKSFSHFAYLKAKTVNEIDIPLEHMARSCDLTQMSYIKLFAKSPRRDTVLFLDNIGTK